MELLNCHVSEESIRLVTETLRSGKLSEGERVKEFESELSRVLGVRNPVAVNSGTSALHLALVLAGVGPGDEVILPPQTFVATGMAVLMCGATPVFADIDPMTGNIDPEQLAKRMTRKTAAVIPVHWGGLPCSMNELAKLSPSYPRVVSLVEDAAHALGAVEGVLPVGDCRHGFAAFSFQATKHLTTGDGGVLCCPNVFYEYEARLLRWFGMDRTLPLGPSGERDCDITRPGVKHHMNDVAASIGLGNLKGFHNRLAKRQAIGKRYREEFEGVKGVTLLRLDPDVTHAYYVFSMLVDRKDGFLRTMRDRGVPASVLCRRIDRHSVFGGVRDYLKGQAEFEKRHVALPCHDGLSEEDVQTVISAVQRGW